MPIELPLIRNGVEYRVYYMTTSDYRPEGLNLFRDASAYTFTSTSVTGLLVTANGKVVEDEDTLAEVFSLFRAASFLYETQGSVNPLGGITSDFEQSLLAVTANPAFLEQQLKGLFAHPTEQYAEALRGILTLKIEPPGLVPEFATEVKDAASNTNKVVDVIDDTLTVAKYSNSRTVRATAASLRKTYESWEADNVYVKLKGNKIELANALDILELSVDLMFLADLQHERSAWLADFEASAEGYAAFDSDQRMASAVIKAETEQNWIQRSDIMLQFVQDKAADLGVRLGEEALANLATKWAWKEYGKRVTGHAIAGAASSVFVGLSVANLLYGLDEMVDGFKIAERANTLRHCFFNGRLNAQIDAAKARARGEATIDGEVVAAYRAAYMLESLAAAQMYRSYADGVKATVQQGLTSIFNPIYWFHGKEWNEGVKQVQDAATAVETQAEKNIGHPDFLDPAVQMALETLKRQAPPSSPVSGDQTATALVVDVSGSMGSSWQGGVKIESAKQAATDVVTMIEQESQFGQGAHQIALVSFTTDASLESPLSADYAEMRAAIGTLGPLQNTNLGAGVEVANQALSAAPVDAQKIAILLSDGLSNQGLSNAEILSGPVQAAADAGTCIYTIGFGDPGEIDEDLLREIAARSGCGTYTYASAPADLERIYIRLRHESTGIIIGEFQGQIAQGETVQIGQASVPANQGQLNVTLQWPGSRLELIAKDPSGKAVADGQPGVSIGQTARMVNMIVQNPATGNWQFAAVGAEVPEQQLVYNLVASVRAATPSVTPPTTTTGGGSAGLLVAFAAAVLIGIPVVVLGAKRRRQRLGSVPASAAARLIGPAGELLPLAEGAVLGRGPDCAIRMADDAVSKHHARFRYARGAWYIQDLNSSNGTFVNGARVTASALRDGDRIAIGPYELKFRIGL